MPNLAYLLGAAVVLDSYFFKEELRAKKWTDEDSWIRESESVNKVPMEVAESIKRMEGDEHDPSSVTVADDTRTASSSRSSQQSWSNPTPYPWSL